MLVVTALFTLFLGVQSASRILNSASELKYDSHQRLPSHLLLYSGSHQCREKISSLHFSEREKVEISDHFLANYFSEDELASYASSCKLICLERGQQSQHVNYPLPQHKVAMRHTENLAGWVDRNCQAVELGFVSYLNYEANVYWINADGEKVEVGKVTPGERNTFWIETYLGHEFQVVNPSNGAIVHSQMVEYNAIVPIGEYHSHTMERDVKALVKQTFEAEWDRAHRVKRTFTEFGFNKGRLPTDLFASMSAFYYNNQNHATIEEWGGKGVFVNWWERDVYFVSMPFKLKVFLLATISCSNFYVTHSFLLL